MAIVDVYNLDSARARTLFSMAKPEDIMQTQMVCIARVQVPDSDYGSKSWAFFDEEYAGPGMISRPYMIVKGTVSELFIEDDDDRRFPCGVKHLRISAFDSEYPDKLDMIPVRVKWKLSSDEISYLYSRGLGYADFGPPPMLKGNYVDIPMNIVYKAIYDTPVSAVRIVGAELVETSSLYNRYDTIFMNCIDSMDMLREKEQGVAVSFNFDSITPVNTYEESADYQSDAVDMNAIHDVNTAEEALSDDEIRANAIMDDINSLLHSESEKDIMSRDEHDSGFSVSDLLSSIKSDIAEEKVEDSDDYYAEVKESNESLKLSDRIGMLKDKTTGNNNSDNADDKTMSNIAETLSEFEMFADTQKLSESDKQKLDAKKQAKKTLDDMRRIDAIQDNMALNADENADISGFGNNDNSNDDNKKPSGNSLSDSLLDDVLGNDSFESNDDKPSGGGSRFL